MLAGLLAGCPDGSTSADASTGGGSSTSSTSSASSTSSTSGTAQPTTGSATTGAASTGTDTPGTDPTGTQTTEVTFIAHPDGGSCSLECDTFVPESCCDPKQKCAAFASDGGSQWNAVKCMLVDPDPDQVGEPCTVADDAVSGVDSCEQGAMCWDVDDVTLEGVCVALCTGTPDDPVCAPVGTTCIITNDGVLNLCLPTCDPLTQDCADGGLCIATEGDPFVCVIDVSGDAGALFDPCEYLNACDAGLACLDSSGSAMCDPRFVGCCLPFCDLTAPVCPADTACAPWYMMGTAPDGLEDVGVCIKP